jgi:hypothetical protein
MQVRSKGGIGVESGIDRAIVIIVFRLVIDKWRVHSCVQVAAGEAWLARHAAWAGSKPNPDS